MSCLGKSRSESRRGEPQWQAVINANKTLNQPYVNVLRHASIVETRGGDFIVFIPQFDCIAAEFARGNYRPNLRKFEVWFDFRISVYI